MARNNVENEQLSEWLQLLGCPVALSPEDLQQLNTPRMRSVWRHLQTHVKPVRVVRTIKKNLLLARLKTESGLFPGQFGNFKIESVQELVKLQKNSATLEEINILRGEIKAVDESLLAANSSLTTKLVEKERKMRNLEELHEKLAILKLKLACFEKDVENLDKELEIANVLKMVPDTQMSSSEQKENKLLVAKYIKKFSSVQITDDYIAEMVVSMIEFPPSTILYGALSVSNHALKILNTPKIAHTRLLPNPLYKLNSLHSSNSLTDLSQMLFKNELELQSISRKIVSSKADLDKEIAVLYKVIEEVVTSGKSGVLPLMNTIDKLVENTLAIKNEENLIELLDNLQNECCPDFDHAKWMLNSCKEKEDVLLTEVNEKLSALLELNEQIITMQVSLVKTEVMQRARDLVSKFLSQLNCHKDEDNQCEILVSENLISKEIEMFLKLPLQVMTRKWEESSETIPLSVREDILKAPERFDFLCQSESKNLIKNIVEKTFWLHTNHNQLTN